MRSAVCILLCLMLAVAVQGYWKCSGKHCGNRGYFYDGGYGGFGLGYGPKYGYGRRHGGYGLSNGGLYGGFGLRYGPKYGYGGKHGGYGWSNGGLYGGFNSLGYGNAYYGYGASGYHGKKGSNKYQSGKKY